MLYLGKKSKVTDPLNRTLQYRNYRAVAPLPTPADTKNWLTGIPSIPMYLNNLYGCCVIAMLAHMFDLWSFLTTGKIIGFSDADIITMYTAIGGFNPTAIPNPDGSNPTDNGCDILTALKYCVNTGFCGYKFAGFAELDITSPYEFEESIGLYGCTALGVQLPLAVQNLSDWPAPPSSGLTGDWTPGSWGGHGIPAGAYSTTPKQQVVETWGTTCDMDDSFYTSFADEAYVCFYPGWVTANGDTPSGLNLAQFQFDQALVTAK